MSPREQIERFHQLDSLPSSYKRKLRVLRALYLKPHQTYTDLKSCLKTQRDESVRPVINELLNEGYITATKRPYWSTHIHAWKVILVYKTLPKADNLILEQVK